MSMLRDLIGMTVLLCSLTGIVAGLVIVQMNAGKQPSQVEAIIGAANEID